MLLLKIILFLVVAVVLGGSIFLRYRQRAMGLDMMNVYRLRMNGRPVYTRQRKFLKANGIPPEIRIGLEKHPVATEEAFRRLSEQADREGLLCYLCYDGFEMDCFRDGRLVISCIDFRKTDRGLDYGGWRFDRNFTSGDFEELFPLSAVQDIHSLSGIESLFGMQTGESTFDKETYMVTRWSKDNLLATPTVEFTFEDGRLIYMFFANF